VAKLQEVYMTTSDKDNIKPKTTKTKTSYKNNNKGNIEMISLNAGNLFIYKEQR